MVVQICRKSHPKSAKGPPKVPHCEGALGDLWGTDFEGVLGRELLGAGQMGSYANGVGRI